MSEVWQEVRMAFVVSLHHLFWTPVLLRRTLGSSGAVGHSRQDGRGPCLVCPASHPHRRSWFDNGSVSRWDEGRGLGAPCGSLHTLKRKQEEENVFVFLPDHHHVRLWDTEHVDISLQMKSGERRAQGRQPSPGPTGPSSSPLCDPGQLLSV